MSFTLLLLVFLINQVLSERPGFSSGFYVLFAFLCANDIFSLMLARSDHVNTVLSIYFVCCRIAVCCRCVVAELEVLFVAELRWRAIPYIRMVHGLLRNGPFCCTRKHSWRTYCRSQ